jgi:hypothetical protein
LKRFISKPPSKKAKPDEPAKPTEQEAPTEDYPELTVCLMIFGRTEAFGDKRRLKVAHREVHTTEPTVPQYLWWSEFPIVFDHRDHLKRIPHQGHTPRHVGSKCLSKVLMNRGSGLNIMYVETFDDLGIARSMLHPSSVSFHGIILDH